MPDLQKKDKDDEIRLAALVPSSWCVIDCYKAHNEAERSFLCGKHNNLHIKRERWTKQAGNHV